MAIGAGVVLFGVNNLLLARVLAPPPRRDRSGLAVVALVTLETRRIPAIATIYATYGFLGFLGHLGVDALAYGRRLPAVMGAALLYDAVVALHRRRQMGLAVGLPLFVGGNPPVRGGPPHHAGLPWVPPSPNMPTADTALVYAGTCLFEGTNLSEGRGTTRPFELLGAPDLDGRWAAAAGELDLPGVHFREAYFAPTFSKFAGTTSGACSSTCTTARRSTRSAPGSRSW